MSLLSTAAAATTTTAAAAVSADMSVLQLIAQASGVVQLVMAALVLASLAAWATIVQKALLLRRVRSLNEGFEHTFWSGLNLNDLYASALRNAQNGAPMERIFASGMREYQKLRERHILDAPTLMSGTSRAMRATAQRELDAIELGLPFLGTIASVSPYVGLFGTVWGVMHAFTGFANMQQITLATVAPGIAEALIATAMGLLAAIPAVAAYNRYASQIDRIANAHDTFVDEFSNILQRNLPSAAASAAVAGVVRS